MPWIRIEVTNNYIDLISQVKAIQKCQHCQLCVITGKLYLLNSIAILIFIIASCYVMLWPALTRRGQEWAQHVQGQLLHTCIMQMAGSHHVMELPLTVYKCRASLVKLLLGITFVLRAVLCVVRIKTQKELFFLEFCFIVWPNHIP